MVSLGGRIAEEIIFDDITTGASQDIKQATSMARAMVTEYGMSEKLGMINYGGDNNEVFITATWRIREPTARKWRARSTAR